MKKTNFKNLEKRFSLFLIDQWGVIHNGSSAYDFVNKTFSYLFKKKKKKIILISNTSQSSNDNIIQTLEKLNINLSFVYKVITSGDLLIYIYKNKLKKFNYLLKILNLKKCYFISNGKENNILNRLKLQNTNFTNSKFILATSIKPVLNITKFKNKLLILKKKKLVMICTNPDKEFFDEKKKLFMKQVGSIADYYQSLGGKVFYIGKPYKDIFDFALKKIKIKKNKILMIGDTMETDILGAKNSNIKSALICKNNIRFKKNFLKNIRKTYTYKPNYILNNLSI